MKQIKLIAALALLLFAQVSFAQEEWYGGVYKGGQIYPGYIVKITGDTVKGFIEYQGRIDMQNKCVFYSDPANKKTKLVYKGEDLKAYYVADKFYKSMNYSGGLMSGPVRFLWQRKAGRIAQYKWFDTAENANLMVKQAGETQSAFEMRQYTSKIIIQKLDEKPIEHSSLGMSFAKKMGEMTADYPEMSTKIVNKENGYGMLKMFELIDQYNAWFEAKK